MKDLPDKQLEDNRPEPPSIPWQELWRKAPVSVTDKIDENFISSDRVRDLLLDYGDSPDLGERFRRMRDADREEEIQRWWDWFSL